MPMKARARYPRSMATAQVLRKSNKRILVVRKYMMSFVRLRAQIVEMMEEVSKDLHLAVLLRLTLEMRV